MDAPSNGGRDSRFNLNTYDMPILSGESASEIYNSNILHNRPTSITSGLSRSSVSMNNSCTSGALPRGIKRTSSEICYDQNMQNRSMLNVNDCGSDIMEDSYSPNHQKNSPLSNGKKTKGRVKIKMEYIDNKLRRYTTFSKRKTGIMKKAYELSTLTGTQVMLLVASETGHVYTFATRKLQPMITSESGKNLIQMCLNSPDPCPSGSGDQRMSATGFEETELSYNVGDDEKQVDSSSCSPYRTDSSDSSEVESVSGSPPASPPPLISLQDLQSTSSTPATKVENGIRCVPLNSFLQGKKITASSSSSPSAPPTVHFVDVNSLDKDVEKGAPSASSSSVQAATNINTLVTDGAAGATATADILSKTSTTNGLIFTLEQLQREFGIHMTAGTTMPQFITIPLLTGITTNNADPPAAHQTPADLSNRSRK